jgi:3-oxoacyl-[acyl-carrier-protein] synthase II
LARVSSWTGRRIAYSIGARGPSITINTACSSGLSSIGQAARLLGDGHIDCAVAGGSDLFSLLSYAGFNSLMALDRLGCRPFDSERDGMSLGDGAAYVVLESENDARARGATVRGAITGYACASEAYHATAPDPSGSGALWVMQTALEQDGGARDLTLIAAHGTGTPANDGAELSAIAQLLRSMEIPGPVYVSSIKGQLGHTLGAAGALQVVASLACIAQNLIPGTAGLAAPMPHELPIVLPRKPLRSEQPLRLALCNSFGFGGSVAALCVRGAEPTLARTP